MRFSFSAAAVLLTAPLLSGCFTALGGGIGYVVDHSKSDYEVASRADLLAQEQGKEVLVTDRDGETHGGRVQGLLAESGEAFAVVYERWRATLPGHLRPPPVGVPLVVHIRTDAGNEILEGELVGFDADAAYLRSGKRGVAADWALIEGWADVGGPPYALPLASVHPDPALPLIASVELLVGDEAEATIPWEDIRTVDIKRSKHAFRNGVLIGAVMDITWIVAIAAMMESMSAFN
jgi:hypothetical protein